MICFKLQAKKQPLRDTKNLNFDPKRYDDHPLPFYHLGIPQGVAYNRLSVKEHMFEVFALDSGPTFER